MPILIRIRQNDDITLVAASAHLWLGELKSMHQPMTNETCGGYMFRPMTDIVVDEQPLRFLDSEGQVPLLDPLNYI
jgi:hypothetical protein